MAENEANDGGAAAAEPPGPPPLTEQAIRAIAHQAAQQASDAAKAESAQKVAELNNKIVELTNALTNGADNTGNNGQSGSTIMPEPTAAELEAAQQAHSQLSKSGLRGYKKFSGLDEDWIPFTINLADAAQSHSGLIVSDFSLAEALDPMKAGERAKQLGLPGVPPTLSSFVYSMLLHLLEGEALQVVLNATAADEHKRDGFRALRKLYSVYVPNDRSVATGLMSSIVNSPLEELTAAGVNTYVGTLRRLNNRLAAVDISFKLPEQILYLIAMAKTPSTWDNFRTHMQFGRDTSAEALTLAMFEKKASEYINHIDARDDGNPNQAAFAAVTRGTMAAARMQPSTPFQRRPKMYCSLCGMENHTKETCRIGVCQVCKGLSDQPPHRVTDCNLFKAALEIAKKDPVNQTRPPKRPPAPSNQTAGAKQRRVTFDIAAAAQTDGDADASIDKALKDIERVTEATTEAGMLAASGAHGIRNDSTETPDSRDDAMPYDAEWDTPDAPLYFGDFGPADSALLADPNSITFGDFGPLEYKEYLQRGYMATDDIHEEWILDTGCTRSVTNDSTAFVPGTLAQADSITYNGINGRVASTASGTVNLRLKSDEGNNIELNLHGVRYIRRSEGDPIVKLISVEQILSHRTDDEHPSINMAGTNPCSSVLTIGGHHVSIGPRFQLHTQPDSTCERAHAAQTPRKRERKSAQRITGLAELHRKLGHATRETIQRTMNVVFDPSETTKCRVCAEADNSRTNINAGPFSMTSIVPTRPLEYLAMDAFDYGSTPGLHGERYVILFVCQLTLMVISYCVKAKTDVYGLMPQLQLTANSCGHVVSNLKVDGDGTHTGARFVQACMRCNIQPRYSAPHTSRQNPRAERYGNIIATGARKLLLQARLVPKLWPYAVRHYTYIYNRLVRTGKTTSAAKQVMPNHDADLTALPTFGTDVLILDHSHARSAKASTPRREGIMLGVAQGSYAFDVLDLGTNRVIKTRDVRTMGDDFTYGVGSYRLSAKSPPFQLTSVPAIVTDSDETATDGIAVTIARPALAAHPGPTQLVQPVPTATAYKASAAPYWAPEAQIVLEAQAPKSLSDALASPSWSAEMRSVVDAHEGTTWQLVKYDDLPDSVKATYDAKNNGKRQADDSDVSIEQCMWRYKVKTDGDNKVTRNKCRIVLRGDIQHESTFDETHAPTVRYQTLRIISAIALSLGMHLQTADFTMAFNNAEIDRDVYMRQPPGFTRRDQQGRPMLCKLLKNLEGSRQGAYLWNRAFNALAASTGFIQLTKDMGTYVLYDGDGAITHLMMIWVDDVLLYCKPGQHAAIFEQFSKQYALTVTTTPTYLLGMNLTQTDSELKISAPAYIDSLLKRFDMEKCATTTTPFAPGTIIDPSVEVDATTYRSIVGSLNFLACTCRPDIAYTCGILARYNHRPCHAMLTAAKRTIRYLQGTRHLGLVYKRDHLSASTATTPNLQLIANSDASYGFIAGDDAARGHSTGGYNTRINNMLVNWQSKLLDKTLTVALSTKDAELSAISLATRDLLFTRHLIEEIFGHRVHMLLTSDSNNAIATIEHGSYFDSSKHIHPKLFHARQLTVDGELNLTYVDTASCTSDIFTKPLSGDAFSRHTASMLS